MFGRAGPFGNYEEHLGEIVFEFGPTIQELIILKIFSIFCTGGRFVKRSVSFWAIFRGGLYEEHLSEIILNLGHQIRRICSLKIFLF